jgi:NAD(P)-dependent dehydrogenase (short-subunit alcohol dehydrogenase family)
MTAEPEAGVGGLSVIVTGAASGIGAATAVLLLEHGANVVAADRDSERLSGLAEPGGSAGRLVRVSADVADPADLERVAAASDRAFGERLDGFVANAGITRAGTAEELDLETWDAVQRVNLRSVFLAARVALPRMRAAGGGSFVAVASQVGLVGMPRNVAYCAAKGGVVNLVRALAVDHAHEGIRCNCVCPGPIDTPMQTEGLRQSGDSANAVVSRVPLGRMGRPEEIAAAILFLISRASSFVVGAGLVADGGYVAV